MKRHIYIKESNTINVISFLEELGLRANAEIILLSEIVVMPEQMQIILKKLTGDKTPTVIVIQDDLTKGGLKDLEQLFKIYFTAGQRESIVNPFLHALNTHTIQLSSGYSNNRMENKFNDKIVSKTLELGLMA